MKKIIIGVVIVSVIVVMILVNILNSGEDSNGQGFSITSARTELVEAENIVRDTLTSSILITGLVEEINVKELKANSLLEIEEVFVSEGDRVQAGDPLFSVDIESMKQELAQLQINYDIQMLTMERLLNRTMNSDDTSMVVALSQARLAQESAQRYYDTQVANLEKNQGMFEAGIISSAEYEAFQSSVIEAESQLASSKLSYQRSSADLVSVRSSNENADLTSEIDVKIQQMTVDGIALNIHALEESISEIEGLTLAPMDGVVTSLTIEEGEMVSAMLPLLTITDIENLKITANIREYDIKDVNIGQQVLVTGDAIGKEDQVRGSVTYIAPIATEAIVNNRQVTGVGVEMSVDTGVDLLKPGYTTECEIITSELVDVVVVSYEMLTTNEEGEDVVFVIDGENKAEMRLIQLGATSDFTAEVISGLEEGELVVINPSLSLNDGSKVEVITEEEGE